MRSCQVCGDRLSPKYKSILNCPQCARWAQRLFHKFCWERQLDEIHSLIHSADPPRINIAEDYVINSLVCPIAEEVK